MRSSLIGILVFGLRVELDWQDDRLLLRNELLLFGKLLSSDGSWKSRNFHSALGVLLGKLDAKVLERTALTSSSTSAA